MSPQIQSVGSDMNVSDARSGALLEVHELSTVFRTRRGEFAAVDRVSFDVAAGEIVALVGESGSGKSVTALSVMGLLDPRVAMVSGGVMRLEGSDLRSLTADALRRLRGKTMAMVFQEPMTSLNPTLTIGRQLSESLELHDSLTRTEAKHRVRSLLHSVGIADPDRRLNAYPHELSGGMRQRVMVASALSCSPRLLLADEPTTALDVTTQAQILELIEQLAAQSGTAVLLITHDLGLVARHADQVNVMYAGRLVERAPVASLFATPAHPYTRALLAAVPRLDRPRGIHPRQSMACLLRSMNAMTVVPSGQDARLQVSAVRNRRLGCASRRSMSLHAGGRRDARGPLGAGHRSGQVVCTALNRP